MNLVEITESIIVDPLEVCSIQEEKIERYRGSSPSDSHTYIDFEGSVMTLKNGRKIFVRGLNPKQIKERLKINEPGALPEVR